jgi:hypothetical protein
MDYQRVWRAPCFAPDRRALVEADLADELAGVSEGSDLAGLCEERQE